MMIRSVDVYNLSPIENEMRYKSISSGTFFFRFENIFHFRMTLLSRTTRREKFLLLQTFVADKDLLCGHWKFNIV